MVNILPEPILTFLVRILLVLLGYLLLRLMQRLVRKLTRSVVRRALSRLHSPEAENTVFEVLTTSANMVALAAFMVFVAAVLSDLRDVFVLLLRLAQTTLLLAAALAIYRLVTFAFASPARLRKATNLTLAPTLLPFARTALHLIIGSLALLVGLQMWGFEITSLIAALGVGSLAISLAAQDTLSNLFGFVAIVGDRPFVVGDYIRTPDVEGTVEHVGLRSTRVRQLDQSFVTVPNTRLANAAIINTTQLSKRVVDLVVGVPYTTAVESIQSALEDVRQRLQNDARIEQHTVNAVLRHIGAQSLEIMVRFYILTPDFSEFLRLQESVLFDVLAIFRQHGLQITSSTNTLYVADWRGAPGSVPDEDPRAAVIAPPRPDDGV
jgi:MscS family membrane protein